MMATKALKLPATRRRMPHFKTHTYIYIHPLPHSSHISLSCLCINVFTVSLSVAVCVSFPGFVAEAFLLLLSSLCSACLHQHFAAIRFPLSLSLSPSSFFTRYCFFVFLFLIFLTHFSLDFVYVFLCAFCVALTARAINFNCAFYASPTHPPLPTHSPTLCAVCFSVSLCKRKALAAAFFVHFSHASSNTF